MEHLKQLKCATPDVRYNSIDEGEYLLNLLLEQGVNYTPLAKTDSLFGQEQFVALIMIELTGCTDWKSIDTNFDAAYERTDQIMKTVDEIKVNMHQVKSSRHIMHTKFINMTQAERDGKEGDEIKQQLSVADSLILDLSGKQADTEYWNYLKFDYYLHDIMNFDRKTELGLTNSHYLYLMMEDVLLENTHLMIIRDKRDIIVTALDGNFVVIVPTLPHAGILSLDKTLQFITYGMTYTGRIRIFIPERRSKDTPGKKRILNQDKTEFKTTGINSMNTMSAAQQYNIHVQKQQSSAVTPSSSSNKLSTKSIDELQNQLFSEGIINQSIRNDIQDYAGHHQSSVVNTVDMFYGLCMKNKFGFIGLPEIKPEPVRLRLMAIAIAKHYQRFDLMNDKDNFLKVYNELKKESEQLYVDNLERFDESNRILRANITELRLDLLDEESKGFVSDPNDASKEKSTEIRDAIYALNAAIKDNTNLRNSECQKLLHVDYVETVHQLKTHRDDLIEVSDAIGETTMRDLPYMIVTRGKDMMVCITCPSVLDDDKLVNVRKVEGPYSKLTTDLLDIMTQPEFLFLVIDISNSYAGILTLPDVEEYITINYKTRDKITIHSPIDDSISKTDHTITTDNKAAYIGLDDFYGRTRSNKDDDWDKYYDTDKGGQSKKEVKESKEGKESNRTLSSRLAEIDDNAIIAHLEGTLKLDQKLVDEYLRQQELMSKYRSTIPLTVKVQKEVDEKGVEIKPKTESTEPVHDSSTKSNSNTVVPVPNQEPVLVKAVSESKKQE